jgi:hypothetical protein
LYLKVTRGIGDGEGLVSACIKFLAADLSAFFCSSDGNVFELYDRLVFHLIVAKRKHRQV